MTGRRALVIGLAGLGWLWLTGPWTIGFDAHAQPQRKPAVLAALITWQEERAKAGPVDVRAATSVAGSVAKCKAMDERVAGLRADMAEAVLRETLVQWVAAWQHCGMVRKGAAATAYARAHYRLFGTVIEAWPDEVSKALGDAA